MNFELALLIKSTLILACAFLANALLRLSSASTRHAIWTMSLLCIFALPAVSFYFPESLRLEVPVLPEPSQAPHDALPPFMQPAAPSSPGTTLAASAATEGATLPPASAPPNRSWRAWILSAWIAGFVIVLFRTVLAMMATRSVSAQSKTPMSPEWASLMTHLRRELDVKQPVDLRIGGDLPPMTWGWRHPIILLPAVADSWTGERRNAVLTHELAHVKRRDCVTQILVQLVCSFYWFNPVVWFAERRLRTERERACDDYVLNRGVGAAPYADHLLEIATGSQLGTFLATVSMAQPSQLETRLLAILNPRLKRGSLSRGTTAVLLWCVFALVICVAGVHVTPLLSLPLPEMAPPGVPTFQASSTAGSPPVLPVQPNPSVPIQQPPAPTPAPDVLLDLPDSEEELLAYLKALAAAREKGGTSATSPVQQPATAPARTVAIVVVLDHSSSMAGTKMDLAKEGTKTALSLLRASDLFGVVTFDYAFQWALPITEARNKEAMQEAINRINAVGNTNMYPALREALQQVQTTTAEAKHIILLTDGQTPAENFQALLSETTNRNITVSTIAVTAASDRKLLSDIAMWGRGRAYYINTADGLPEIFQREVSLVVGKVQ